MNNLAAYIETVATHYWGEPRERKGNELRWGQHGSKSVDLRKGTWFDFELNEGGGVVDLVKVNEGATISGLPDLMEKKFGIARQVQEKLSPVRYISKVYDYANEHGEVVFQVVRYEPKTFRQRQPDGEGGWVWNMQGVEPLPFNLPDILARPEKPIFIVEGEKCAQALSALGAVATTSHGGAKKWAAELNKWFEGRDVIILPDADQPGQDHADMVTANLVGVARSVKRLDLPGLSEKDDVFDWLSNGGTAQQLAELAKAAPEAQTAPDIEHIEVEEEEPDLFQVYDINYLRKMPPVEFIVEGLLTRHGVAVMYGEPGAGKSFLAIDLALSIAYGTHWHGQAVEQGAVLYIAGEGVGGLGKRIKAWQAHYDMKGEVPFFVLPTAVRFREPEDVERLLRTIDSLGVKFKAVFIDTVARALLGGDENSSTDMGLFIDSCEIVKRHCNCALIAIHHSGKDAARGMRGSTALLGAVDTSVRIMKKDGNVELSVEKQKDAEPIPEMTFEMLSVALLDDTSVVMKTVEVEPEKKKRQVKLTLDQDIALQALRNLVIESRHRQVTVSMWHEAHKNKTPDVTAGKRRDARAALQNKGVIVIDNNKVWINKGLDSNV